MKTLYKTLRTQLLTMLMLCLSVPASADVVEIDGIFYNLRNGWSYSYFDFNGNGVGNSPYYEHAAIVTYDPNVDLWSQGKETYSGDIQIPEKVTNPNDGVEYTVVAVGGYAFLNCYGLTAVDLPASVLLLEYQAFDGCKNLTSVTMPGVESINSSVFRNCNKFSAINLPKTLKCFRNDTFNESYFSAINVDADNEDFTSDDGVLYNKAKTDILAFPRKKTGSYTIPATITTIQSNDFPWGGMQLEELTIPATVTKIEHGAFPDNQIKKLVIEDSPNELVIGKGSYGTGGYTDENDVWQSFNSMFYNLQELYWGRPVRYLSANDPAFAGHNLNKVVFGENVTTIPEYSFLSCSNLFTIDVKGGIGQWCNFDFTEEGTFPFEYAMMMPYPDLSDEEIDNLFVVLFNGAALTGNVVVPETVTKIPAHGFQYGCSGVTDLTLPAALTSVVDGAFRGLSSLENIHLNGDCANFEVINNVLYNKAVTKIICFPQQRAGGYAMPGTITEMADYQFYNCAKLTDVVFSNQLRNIGISAFYGCSQLTMLTIPASIETISDNAFNGCTGITKLVIEDATTPLVMGQGNIQRCDEWGTYYYEGCGIFGASPISEVYIGRNLEHKSNYSDSSPFTDILANVTIGNKVNSLPKGLFRGCCGILSVNFDGTIIDWCNITFKDIYATPFGNNCGASPILYLEGEPLHSQVNIPAPAKKVGAYAFYGQNGVENITLPSTMEVIEPYAFYGAGDVYINVDENATDVISLTDANSFSGDIYVSDAFVTTYRNANVWKNLASRIHPLGFTTVTVDLIAMEKSPALLPALNALEVVNGEYRITALTHLKIRGTMNGWDIMMIRNKMPNLRHLDLSEATILDNDGGHEYYTGNHVTGPNIISTHSFFQLNSLRTLKLPLNVITIEEDAISNCPNLQWVELPEQLTSIGYGAFRNCPNLRQVLYMPASCTDIAPYAFASTGLTSIEINSGVKTIGSYAFQNCGSLTNVTFTKGLEYINYSAFRYSGLKKLVLPTTLKRIDSYAFANCNNLEEIDFAEGLTEIGSCAFYKCSNLKELHLPTSLRTISENAFQYCSGLSEIHVPSMMHYVGDYAFKNCGLKSVYAYTVTPIQINQNTFDYNGVDLYAPDNSFYAYYLNTQWSQFQDVKMFETIYDKWYTSRYTDIEINTIRPIRGGDGLMEPGSGLIITGSAEQLVKKLILNWEHGSNYPSLIENHNLSVEELKFLLNAYPHRWYFFCFPFDVRLTDVKHPGKWVWRYYDGLARAAYGTGGWKNVEDGWLRANTGYIFQCNAEGDLEMKVLNPNFSARTRQLEIANGEEGKEVGLQAYQSANAQDASWNLVGNPNLSYYNMSDMPESAAGLYPPITVWDDEQQTYTAVVPGDDDYEFHPFEAFFVQKTEDCDALAFLDSNRETYNDANNNQAARRKARAAKPIDVNRLLVNVELSDGSTTDKTRVVFDDSKSMDYEAGKDANKFMSLASVPQIYTLDGKNVKYAVNNRPNGSHEVRLGVTAPVKGDYSIDVPRMDFRVCLKDIETGIVHDFSTGAYSFHTEGGTFDNRFVLMANTNLTGISEKGIEGLDIMGGNGSISISGIGDTPVNIYNAGGVRVAVLNASGSVQLQSGTYIVGLGNKTSKVLVK